MTIEEVIEYILNTPHNTNRAILTQILTQLIQDNSEGSNEDIVYDGGMEI